MRNILTLVKINCINYIRSFSQKRKGTKNPIKLLILIYGLIFISVFGYAYPFGEILSSQGLADIILLIGLLGGSMLSLMMSISSSQSYIYSSSDTELLLSLPIKKSEVVLSKVISLYITTLLFFLTMFLPFGIVYAINVNPSFIFYFGLIFTVLFGNLLFITVGMIVGFLVGLIGNGLKNKGLYQTLVTVLLLSVFMFFYIRFTSMGEVDTKDPDALAQFVLSMSTFKDNIFKVFYPIKILTIGLANVDINLPLGILLNVLPFTLVILLISVTYNKMLSIFNKSYRSGKKALKKYKRSALLKTLIKKEARTVFFNANIAMNTVMIPIISIIMLIAYNFMDMGGNYLYPLILCVLFTYLNTTSSSLVSLEGRNIELIKSMPINEKQIIKAKVLFAFFASCPFALIQATVLYFTTKNIDASILALSILPLSCLFNAMLGLYINIKKPDFKWENPIKVVKQGASVLFSVLFGFVGAIIVSVMIVVLSLLLEAIYVSIILLFVLIIMNLVIFKLLFTKGVKEFALLEI